MMPGMPEKRTHDYVRHGTTSLFAAFNTADGTVISNLYPRHRAIEFKKFLTKIDSEIPDGLDVHLICDNYGTHKSPTVKRWLEANPRFTIHFTPTYSSWINQVERFFAYGTADLLQRSDHRSVQALEADIRKWVKGWNENPRPFIWTKTTEQILESLKRLLQRTNGAGHSLTSAIMSMMALVNEPDRALLWSRCGSRLGGSTILVCTPSYPTLGDGPGTAKASGRRAGAADCGRSRGWLRKAVQAASHAADDRAGQEERMTVLATERTFIPFSSSHWFMLLLVAAGAVLVVCLGRALRGIRAEKNLTRGFAIVLLAYAGTMLIVDSLPARWNIDESLPLHISDLTWMTAVYALWTRSRWAFALTYYWGLTLNPQAMITPAVRPGFPDFAFIDFWLQHALVVWAAVYLTWGLGLRPDWAAFRTAAAVTVGWAVVVFCFNAVAGTNYGFLNAKPDNPSALDLMGPWPRYLVVEPVVVLTLWALITWPWTRPRKW